MHCTLYVRGITLSLLLALSTAEPKAEPQFYPLFPGPPAPQFVHPAYSNSQPWHRTPHNYTHTIDRSGFMGPLPAAAADDLLRNQVPRQVYGVPPPQVSGTYPQIYKIDNLIIIANPVQQAQPCIPQPQPRPPPPATEDDGLDTRFGPAPSPCTWAIVACCSPGSTNIRYSCFELFNCAGFFVDNSPCNSKIKEAAARTALEYYRNANTNSANSTQTNRV